MDPAHGIPIHPPLAGEWKVLQPPGHHPYALDLVQLDDGRKSFHAGNRLAFFLNGVPSERFICWNRPVYAPVDGTVIRVGNDWSDHAYASLWQSIRLWYDATFRFRPRAENGRLDIRPNAGNHVMIQAREGHIVLLAHLRNHSITVAEGAQVRHGDTVGMVGSSGNSAIPHLHINLFDQMEDPLGAKVLPFVLRSYESLARDGRWIVQQSALPDAGAVVRFRIPDRW